MQSQHWQAELPIAVVGGGLLGRLLAWRLLRAGWRVQLWEKDPEHSPGGAAWTAAGMVSPLSELAVSHLGLYQLGMSSLDLWPQWLAELGAEDCWQAPGTLVLAHGQDRPLLTQFEQQLRYHLPHWRSPWLNAEQIQQRDSGVQGRALVGMHLEGEAYIDGPRLMAHLLRALRQLGAELHFSSPIEGELSLARLAPAQAIFDCRGRGAQLDGLRGVRGELMRVHCPAVRLQHALRLMHPRYLIYVVPRPEQQFIIGASEIESEDRSAMSLRTMLELGTALYSINPAFAEARVLQLDTNLRPAMLHNDPILRHQQGVWQLNGLYRHGYLLAPAWLQQLAELLPSIEGDYEHRI